ncbi:S1 family peptidase [Flindersiella endophytica]
MVNAITDQRIAELTRLLTSCTAAVVFDESYLGTAFFVNDHQLLTSAHVVRDNYGAVLADRLMVQPVGRHRRDALVAHYDEATDLALLEVRADEIDYVQPCVLLHRENDGGSYLVAGYPREDHAPAGIEAYEIDGHLRRDLAGEPDLIQLTGERITWGMSGGPVADLSTGAVVGVIRTSNDPNDDRGGSAVPISHAARLFPRVRDLLTGNLPSAIGRWRDFLGEGHWRGLGHTWELTEQIDLRISGTTRGWQVVLGGDVPSEYAVTGRDLGEDVAEALFAWSRRGRLRRKEEVELIGRLLAGALLPKAVADRLRRLGDADQISINLIFEGQDNGDSKPLANIPWELAAVPGVPGMRTKFLASEPKYRFVRIPNGQGGAGPMARPEDKSMVLAAISRPASWTSFRKVAKRDWPSAEDIAAGLEQAVEQGNFGFTAMVGRVTLSDLDDRLKERPYDVLHYIGAGGISRDSGDATAWLTDDRGDQAEEQSLAEILELAREARVPIVVFEFTLPPDDLEEEPVPIGSIVDALPKEIRALVATSLPVHPGQLRSFNTKFYQALGAGAAIDQAVQLGRYVLQRDKPMNDFAVFGSFTLITGDPELRLASSVSQAGPSRPGRRPLTTDRPLGRSASRGTED